MGDYKKAYDHIKKSFDIFIKNRDRVFTFLSNKQKELYLKDNSKKIPFLLKAGYKYLKSLNNSKQLNIKQELTNSWLAYKGAILQSENIIATLYAQTQDPHLKEQIDALRTAQRAHVRLIHTAPELDKAEQYQARLKTLSDRIDTLMEQIAVQADSLRIIQELKKSTYRDIATLLAPDEIYVDYARAGRYYYLFVIDPSGHISFDRITASKSTRIDTLVETFRTQIHALSGSMGELTPDELQALLKQSTPQTQAILSELYTLLIHEPLASMLVHERPDHPIRPIFSPDGALRLLPFEAL
jgi:hypothetical protein